MADYADGEPAARHAAGAGAHPPDAPTAEVLEQAAVKLAHTCCPTTRRPWRAFHSFYKECASSPRCPKTAN